MVEQRATEANAAVEALLAEAKSLIPVANITNNDDKAIVSDGEQLQPPCPEEQEDEMGECGSAMDMLEGRKFTLPRVRVRVSS